MNIVRTPDERFLNLPDFSYTPHYAEVKDPTGGDPLRMAYIDEGPRDGQVMLLLHGEPSWSFLYRKMIPILVGAGHRVIAPDLIGFGRSDKPAERSDYTYLRHVEWVRELLFDKLDLHNITYFGQDWGSLLGLQLVGLYPERYARVVIGNGGLPTGDHKLSDAFFAWQTYSQTTPELKVGNIVSGGCKNPLPVELVAAYDAPFPDDTFKEGARQFPLLVPSTPEDPTHDTNVRAWEGLQQFTKPFLLCFSDSDPVMAGGDKVFASLVPGTKGQDHVTIKDAGHFLQEDKGEEIANLMLAFIAKN